MGEASSTVQYFQHHKSVPCLCRVPYRDVPMPYYWMRNLKDIFSNISASKNKTFDKAFVGASGNSRRDFMSGGNLILLYHECKESLIRIRVRILT